jgi:hypothetical protein
MLDSLAPDDVVTETRLDRLARSTFDLFAIVKQIVDAKSQFRHSPNRGPTAAPATRGLMTAVLGELADVGATLSAPAPPKAAAGRRSAGSAWAGRRKLTPAQKAEARRATGARRNACRTRPQLRRGKEHDFTSRSLDFVSRAPSNVRAD